MELVKAQPFQYGESSAATPSVREATTPSRNCGKKEIVCNKFQTIRLWAGDLINNRLIIPCCADKMFHVSFVPMRSGGMDD